MKRIYLVILTALIIGFTGCGVSKPNVPAVEETEPWAAMKLPCKASGVVVQSNERMYTCAYAIKTNDRDVVIKTIAPYLESLQKDGWKMTKDTPNVAVQYEFEKGDKQLMIHSTSPALITNSSANKWEGFGIQAEIWNKG